MNVVRTRWAGFGLIAIAAVVLACSGGADATGPLAEPPCRSNLQDAGYVCAVELPDQRLRLRYGQHRRVLHSS